jgi:hypothetical protein
LSDDTDWKELRQSWEVRSRRDPELRGNERSAVEQVGV